MAGKPESREILLLLRKDQDDLLQDYRLNIGAGCTGADRFRGAGVCVDTRHVPTPRADTDPPLQVCRVISRRPRPYDVDNLD